MKSEKLALQLPEIRLLLPAGQLKENLGCPGLVAAHDAVHQLDEHFPRLAVHHSHHAEIQQADDIGRAARKMFPGCGSAWKNPCERPASDNVGSTRAKQPASVAGPASSGPMFEI